MSNRMLHIARMAYHELVREGATIQAHLADIFVDEVVWGFTVWKAPLTLNDALIRTKETRRFGTGQEVKRSELRWLVGKESKDCQVLWL